MTPPPFVVLSLPRSRSYWLSRYLSYGGWHCGHEEIRHARTLSDVRAWLARPRTGTAETAAGPFWRLLRRLAPHTRVAVVRRDPAAVFNSLLRLGLPFDAAVMARQLRRFDAALDEIEAHWPGALSVTFDGLREEATCALVFEHCLGLPHNPAWWASLAPQNLQADIHAVTRDMVSNAPLIAHLQRGIGRRDYTARLEVLDNGQTFAHLDVHRWTARSAAAMRRDLDAVIAWHRPIYVTQTAHPHNDDFDKWRKFVTMMGFKFRNTAPNGWSVYVLGER